MIVLCLFCISFVYAKSQQLTDSQTDRRTDGQQTRALPLRKKVKKGREREKKLKIYQTYLRRLTTKSLRIPLTSWLFKHSNTLISGRSCRVSISSHAPFCHRIFALRCWLFSPKLKAFDSH